MELNIAIDDQRISTSRAELETITHPVVVTAGQLTVASADQYKRADMFLAELKQARLAVAEKLDPIIRPIRAGLDRLYSIRRDLDGPLEEAEKQIKTRMARYQEGKRKRVQEEERVRREKEEQARRDAERLAREREEAEERARVLREQAQAQTQPAAPDSWKERVRADAEARKLARDAEIAAAKQAEAQNTIIPGPVKGGASRVVVKKQWRVVDMQALVEAVAVGEVPLDVLTVDTVRMNAYWRGEPERVLGFPGVVVEDVTSIANR